MLRSTSYELQRFSELCENQRVSSYQILKGRTDRQETTLRIMNDQTRKGIDIVTLTAMITVSTVSDVSVPMSKFDVTRPSNFHKVLKTSVQIYLLEVHALCKQNFNQLHVSRSH